MVEQRNYSTEFKRQAVLEHLAGETLHGLPKRHDVSRNVIRLWIARYEADGDLDDDTTLVQEGTLSALSGSVRALRARGPAPAA